MKNLLRLIQSWYENYKLDYIETLFPLTKKETQPKTELISKGKQKFCKSSYQ